MEKNEGWKAQDEENFKALFAQYLPIVYSMEARYLIKDFDFDDWLQEGRIALNDAIQSYRHNQGTTLGLYYKMVFENRIRSLLRRQQAQKRLAQHKACSIERLSTDDFGSRFHYEPYVEEDLCICETLIAGDFSLSPLEKQVLYYYIKGEEISVIAKQLSETSRAVQNAINRTKNKIRRKLCDNE